MADAAVALATLGAKNYKANGGLQTFFRRSFYGSFVKMFLPCCLYSFLRTPKQKSRPEHLLHNVRFFVLATQLHVCLFKVLSLRSFRHFEEANSLNL
jgi:hypothetical protein